MNFIKQLQEKLFIIFTIACCCALQAQNGATNSTGSRSNGVANASVGFSDINSIFNNQAGLANLQNMGFILSSEQRFALAELNSFGGGFALPTNSGTFGVSVHYFGFDSYNESKIGLSYARKLMDKLSIGVQFDLLSTQIAEYGSQNFFTFEVGLQSELMENLLIGIHLYNPVKIEIIEDEFLPTVLRAGATYSPSTKFNLHVEVEKDLDFPFIFKSGVEYALVDDFWLRIGVQTNPTALSFGLGYLFKNGFRFDLASSYHQDLGFSPGIGIGYDFSKGNKKGKRKKKR